jgi:hypothetical protein
VELEVNFECVGNLNKIQKILHNCERKEGSCENVWRLEGQGQCKVHPITGHEGPDRMYYFFNTGARWAG